MANHRAKGVEYMRALAKRGGLASGETRRRKLIAKLFELPEVPVFKEPNRSGGSNENDWRCPVCRRFNSIKLLEVLASSAGERADDG